MVEISDDDFERMVSEVFDALPGDMVRGDITLVHEIGHSFGLDDARLHELGWA